MSFMVTKKNKKGYYCVSDSVDIKVGLQYCMAGGDEGMTFNEAWKYACMTPGTYVVDKDGKVYYYNEKSN